LQPVPSIPPLPRPSIYLILSYQRRRCCRLAILTAVYRSWLTERETGEKWEKWLTKIKFRPNGPYIPCIYLWYNNIWHSEETHIRTSVYLYSDEEWRRVCAIWILIIKISRGFDRFLTAQKRSGSHHKYFRYLLNVDDVSRVHARVLYKSLGKIPFRFSPDSVKNWTFYRMAIQRFPLPTSVFLQIKFYIPVYYNTEHE